MEETVVRLMQDAAMAEARQAAHRATIVGRVAFYHGSLPIPAGEASHLSIPGKEFRGA